MKKKLHNLKGKGVAARRVISEGSGGGGALIGGSLQYKDIGTATEVGESYGLSVLLGCDWAHLRGLTPEDEQKLFKYYCLGTQGIAVTFVAQGEEDRLFRKMEEKIGNKIDSLPGIDNLMQGLNIFSALSDCGCSL